VNNTGIGTGVVLPLVTKGTTILHHPFDLAVWMKQVEEERADVALLVPAMMNMILKNSKSDELVLDTLKRIGTGSAPPSIWALEELKTRFGIDVINIWGQNEGPGIYSGPLTTPIEKRMQFPQFGKKGVDWGIDNPFFKAVETKILNPDTGEELSEVGEVGELLWRGPWEIPCYYKKPELTARAFEEDGFLHTGDLFKIEENNFITYFGRRKDIIIRGGQKISAQEVENLVLKHPAVREAAAVPMPDPVLGEKTCVYVVMKSRGGVTLNDITALFEGEGVAKYKWPERLEIIDEIPKNPLGKSIKAGLKNDIKKKLKNEGEIKEGN
jgi:non-ribosomal peptide synthetase component E (peptide arylation enzyme)